MKFDSKSVFLPEITLNGYYLKDMELEGVLPEYAPDISRLVRVDAKASPPEVEFTTDKAEITARVDFGILYESDYKSKLAHVVVSGTLSQKVNHDRPSEERYAWASVNCSYLTCKLLGPRKFIIRAKMNTELCVSEIKEFGAVDPDSGQVSAYFLTQKLGALSPIGEYTGVSHAEQSVGLPQPVDHIVYACGEVSSAVPIAAEGRLSVKCDVTFKALYATEEGEYSFVSNTYPVSVDIDNQNITPGQSFCVSAHVTSAEAVADIDDYGENKLLKQNFTVAARAVCFESGEDAVASDGFCGDRESACVVTKAEYNSLAGTLDKTFVFEMTHDTEKNDITELLDTAVAISVSEQSYADGVLNIKGNINFEALAKTESGIISEDFSGEFEKSIVTDIPGEVIAGLSVRPLEVMAGVSGGEIIAVKVNVAVRASIFSKTSLPVLSEFIAEDMSSSSDGGIRFYYPDSSESAWSVAKKYRRNPKKLMDDNRSAFEDNGSLKGGAVYLTIR
ncbi:MAG: hypothetical protein WCR95_04880 [Eubacteriales bacterium]